ncbi:MAG: hypothetical protein ACREJU_02835 [Nitrospiraceae bacterium]
MSAILAGLPFSATAREHLISDRDPIASFSGKTTPFDTATTQNSPLSSGLSNNLLSQPPMLTGRYTLNGQTFMPYIGAGFSGGETKDPNRAAVRESAAQEDRLLREPLGSTLVPNEFQLGVRIPF